MRPTLTSDQVKSLLETRYRYPVPCSWAEQLAKYVELLYHWNTRISLTAIPPLRLIELDVAECLLAAHRIPQGVRTVLDFGSGAGLPGIPIQIARPELQVTLAESQKKKASFLREAVRELALATEVYAGRVEDMPQAQQFDLVTLRAVDAMHDSLSVASGRVITGGTILIFTSLEQMPGIESNMTKIQWQDPESIPETDQRVLLFGTFCG